MSCHRFLLKQQFINVTPLILTIRCSSPIISITSTIWRGSWIEYIGSSVSTICPLTSSDQECSYFHWKQRYVKWIFTV